jgi:hypothetical protein
METSLAWPHNSDAEKARRAASLLDEAVTAYRNRGHTREHALRLAARMFGLRLRRARALLYGEPVVIPDAELARIRASFLAHLDAEAADLADRSAKALQRLQRMLDKGS